MSSDEAEFDDQANDEDEDMPLAESSSSRKRRASSSVNYAEDDDEEDDYEEEEEEEDEEESSEDEDVPLSALKESPKKKPTQNGKKKQPPKKKEKTTPKKKKTTPSKTSTPSSSSTKYASLSAAFYGSKCDKGLLIQRLLCRWWYAISWPDTSKLPQDPPENCDALDGFPGVYVCTKGDEVGKIIDLRDKDKAPSFANLVKKTSEELKELLIKAIEEQLKQLIEVEGSGTETVKELNSLLKWTKKVKCSKADKDGEKVMKKMKVAK